MTKIFYSGCVLLCTMLACKKDVQQPCDGIELIKPMPIIGEMVGDSVFQTDTAFTGNIVFDANGDFENIIWQIGADSRMFNQQTFSLRFPEPTTTVQVSFTADIPQNKVCFPDESRSVTVKRDLTILPRDNFAKTPLVGTYLGAVVGKPLDTFLVSIQFWSDSKYHMYTGPQPFCTISNFPKDYRDTISSLGRRFSELSYGYLCDWGYKALYINENQLAAKHTKGYAYLVGSDTLVINYSRADLNSPYSPNLPNHGYPEVRERFIGIRKR